MEYKHLSLKEPETKLHMKHATRGITLENKQRHVYAHCTFGVYLSVRSAERFSELKRLELKWDETGRSNKFIEERITDKHYLGRMVN